MEIINTSCGGDNGNGMRYEFNINKAVNSLMPRFLRGRTAVFFLQGVLEPLRTLGLRFQSWAEEKRIEASMTSQVFYFEWYLNHKFGRYYARKNTTARISIPRPMGNVMFMEKAENGDYISTVLYSQIENMTSAVFFCEQDGDYAMGVSFVVFIPSPDTSLIDPAEYKSMVEATVESYRISGKTYRVEFV